MKYFALVALLGASAQDIDFCEESSECDTAKYGEDTCCSILTYVSFADDNDLGDFTANVLGGEENLVAGGQNTAICIHDTFRADLEEEMAANDGTLSYYNDVRLFRESDAGLLAAYTDTEEWIADWNADLDSMNNFIAKRSCMEDLMEMSTGLVASSLAVAAAVAATL